MCSHTLYTSHQQQRSVLPVLLYLLLLLQRTQQELRVLPVCVVCPYLHILPQQQRSCILCCCMPVLLLLCCVCLIGLRILSYVPPHQQQPTLAVCWLLAVLFAVPVLDVVVLPTSFLAGYCTCM